MEPSFHNAVVDCIPLGFNTVINRAARDLIVSSSPRHSCGPVSYTHLDVYKRQVLYCSDAPDEMVRALHMTPVHSVEEGLRMAEDLLQKPDATVTVIPDGVSVMVV